MVSHRHPVTASRSALPQLCTSLHIHHCHPLCGGERGLYRDTRLLSPWHVSRLPSPALASVGTCWGWMQIILLTLIPGKPLEGFIAHVGNNRAARVVMADSSTLTVPQLLCQPLLSVDGVRKSCEKTHHHLQYSRDNRICRS